MTAEQCKVEQGRHWARLAYILYPVHAPVHTQSHLNAVMTSDMFSNFEI